MNQWQTMESAPRDGTWILLYHRHARISDWYFDGVGWTNDAVDWHPDEDTALAPTHWMPIPPEPVS